MKSVHFSKAAFSDLKDIDDYSMKEWGEAQAEQYLTELEACILRLVKNPMLGRPCAEIRPGLRRIETGKHVIFYRLTEGEIWISRILHQSMLPGGERFARED